MMTALLPQILQSFAFILIRPIRDHAQVLHIACCGMLLLVVVLAPMQAS